MASSTASSRAHLIKQLSRKSTVSPAEEDFVTASSASFDAAGDALHSTAQLDYTNTTQQQLPSRPQASKNKPTMDNMSQSSSDMSIELPRGLKSKKGARDRDDDLSSNLSNIRFDMGNGSIYSLTGTPPLKPRDAEPKPAGKQGNKVNAQSTRFSRPRQVSSRETSAQAQQAKTGANNTASNSFVLPDMPNITELVSGVRKDGTPVFNRQTKSRSRFTSNTYKPASQEHRPVESAPVPQEEKAIYASLQLLKERVDQLEMEKSETQLRAEEYESEIIELRSQLAVALRRPDSALGSDDESSAQEKWNQEKKKLQASTKSLQDRLDRSERKISVSEIAVKRVTKERDELITQMGVAYCDNEELKAENEEFRDSQSHLQSENEDLKVEVDALRRESQDLRALMAQTEASYKDETVQRDKREAQLRKELQKKVANVVEEPHPQQERKDSEDHSMVMPAQQLRGRKSQNTTPGVDAKDSRVPGTVAEETTKHFIARKLANAVKENRDARAAARASESSLEPSTSQLRKELRASANHARSARPKSTDQEQVTSEQQASSIHSRSRSADEPKVTNDVNVTPATSKRSASATAENDDQDTTTQLDFSRVSTDTVKQTHVPGRYWCKAAMPPRRDDSRDSTLLSWQDPFEVQHLRHQLEEERAAEKARADQRKAWAADLDARVERAETTLKPSLEPALKPSLKAGAQNCSGCLSSGNNVNDSSKIVKTVRIQSPHTTDESINAAEQSENDDTSNLPQKSETRAASNLTQKSEISDASNLSNSSRRRRPASTEQMTSEFIVPDLSFNWSDPEILHSTPPPPEGFDPSPWIVHDPVAPSKREVDVDITDATIRPAQDPAVALATVVKQLEDEIAHLKIKLRATQRMYSKHDPAMSKRRRKDVKAQMDMLTAEIEKRSDQIYSLYDVIEGQKQEDEAKKMTPEEVENTISSIGIEL